MKKTCYQSNTADKENGKSVTEKKIIIMPVKKLSADSAEYTMIVP